MRIMDILEDSPVIAAVKNEQDLAAALESECEVVFFLFGTILSLAGLVQRVKAAGKVALVHADLVEGLGNREVAVDALKAPRAPFKAHHRAARLYSGFHVRQQPGRAA